MSRLLLLALSLLFILSCTEISSAAAENRAFSPRDSGPIYVETMRAGGAIVEPWNTTTNLAFLGLIVFWTARLRPRERRHPFLWACMPILLLGWIGGTVYHGTRSNDLWYAMDFVPIALLALALAGYAWLRAVGDGRRAALYGLNFFAMTYVLLRLAAARHESGPLWWYTGLAINAIVPLILFARRTNWKDASWLFTGLTIFALALTFRQHDIEMKTWLPMGSHFIWHLLGATSVHCLCIFVYRADTATVPVRNQEARMDSAS
jgi:hemolysin III